MKISLKLEELAMFLLAIYGFSHLDYAWWFFLVFLLAPDLGALGYIFGNKVGAFIYNLFHHKGVAIAIFLLGIYVSEAALQFAGIILFAHAALDRIFGYGLKYSNGFKYTHLGEIGKKQSILEAEKKL